MSFSIAVLISGGGTTLRNLIKKRKGGELVAEIRLVISSNPAAKGIDFARQANIATSTIDHRNYRDPESISNLIFEQCRIAGVDLVVMGGFLRKLLVPDDFIHRVINIHPSLIPAFSGTGFYGMRVHRAVIDSGAKISGCTIHFVDNQYDHGPIIAQKSLVVEPDNSAEQLAERIFQLECQLYPQVINAIALGRVEVHGDEVVVLN